MPDTQALKSSQPSDFTSIIGKMLLEEGLLLVCDATTGKILHANEAAIFLLELSEDCLSDYDFGLLCEPIEETASDLWSELVVGARRHWSGSLQGILSGTQTPVQVMATLAEESGSPAKVVLFGRVFEHGAGQKLPAGAILSGLDTYLGIIEFNADGQSSLRRTGRKPRWNFLAAH